MAYDYTSLKEYLLECAQSYVESEHVEIHEIINTLLNDVATAMNEPLEIFPVCHHSPASAFRMVHRLRHNPPEVIYLELCEDLISSVQDLKDCKFPVALQAFANNSEEFDNSLAPFSVIAPITEASAEYQAICYALNTPGVELVFVDRAVDYIFQWDEVKPGHEQQHSDEDENIHKGSYGIEIGNIAPTFEQFTYFLLKNARVRYFSEWWDQYVDQVIIESDYRTYREVMYLIGSIFRRLGKESDELRTDRLREQYMWTRIKNHMKKNKVKPKDALYICGALHSVSDVEEFGVKSKTLYDIPERTSTEWLYGIVPSSFMAVEYQFGSAPGTVMKSESTWKKSLKIAGIVPFSHKKTKKSKPGSEKESGIEKEKSEELSLDRYLTRPPVLEKEDEKELIQWCGGIVSLARKNGYLASTADSIAIYETSLLLANIRNRRFPSLFDFQDAAVTCLEKDYTPKKRNIAQLCQVLFGADRIGTVGYGSLPPLVQNIYDRLSPLKKVKLEAKTIQRALMDFKKNENLLDCSDVLWRIHYLFGDTIVQPIMGERTLGHVPGQESWDIRIGKYQGVIIQLGYEGITIEQVIEQRIKKEGFSPGTKAHDVLFLAEDSVLYLDNDRLTEDLGNHAIDTLTGETGVKHAGEIFFVIRNFVHYYRSHPLGLPEWIKNFVNRGYSHYITLLPVVFEDRGVSPAEVCGMFQFIFHLESLALSLGCSREQLLISVGQIDTTSLDPKKAGLLWGAQWLLKLLDLNEVRSFFDHLLETDVLSRSFPDYLGGLLLALNFAEGLSYFIVEVLSKVFALTDDSVLISWMPELMLTLKDNKEIIGLLINEVSKQYPSSLNSLIGSDFFWEKDKPGIKKTETPEHEAVALSNKEQKLYSLLKDYPSTVNYLAGVMGNSSTQWKDAESPETGKDTGKETKAKGLLLESETRIKELINEYDDIVLSIKELLD